MEAQIKELKTKLLEINDLNSVAAVLSWDQTTYMPQQGGADRGRQMGMVAQMAMEKTASAEMRKLIDKLRPYGESLDQNSDEAALIRLAAKSYDLATKFPPEMIGAFYAHTAESYGVWAQARPANDFAATIPYLEKTIEFTHKMSEYIGGGDHVMDPIINMVDEGMTTATVSGVFDKLRAELVPLVQAVTSQPTPDDSFLYKSYPEADQLAFGESVIQAYGFDFTRGRQDKTAHPFMTKFAQGDVRITTRVDENNLIDALFSTLHECGHALYELGVSADYANTPLDSGASSGVHESQSRTWENIVGRSRGFWQYYLPKLKAVFPTQLDGVSLDAFYKAINKVEKSLIRVDADELTYNLHVMIRFDLEKQLMEGKLAVKDLADAWHARYEQDLGVRAPNDIDGVLQDVHWYSSIVGGAFQGYTLGNIMSAAIYDQALAAHPEIPTNIENGQFETLHTWLKDNVYTHGAKYTAPDLIERVTGAPLSIEPYMRYLKTKYSGLYNL